MTSFVRPPSVLNISLDSEAYEQDYTLKQGNGPTFPFAVGTEPISAFSVTEINQTITKNKYTLSFTLNGYAGAEIYSLSNGKEQFIANCTSPQAVVTTTVNTGKCSFKILPYTLDGKEKKRYGSAIITEQLHNSQDNKKTPPDDRWWDDNDF